ncbi:hypothetical protein [Aquibacillus albus]|uniref:RNA polymerase sigma-70 region 4 domain-containing protein n=1 Tax=Aquibacillus albus TaxID=1168171 RepID=A0ABS2N631_9BACI|nr:hypothetical protein [Aquibacillus albus]MBM7573607.1 hypothetical protein [Aquibacillus albus]
MENKDELNDDNITFFKEMIAVPSWGARRSYYKILKHRKSEKFIRFIGIYKALRPLLLDRLSERELFILDEFYGLKKESIPINELASTLCISRSRVIQVRNNSERKIRRVFHELKRKNTNLV